MMTCVYKRVAKMNTINQSIQMLFANLPSDVLGVIFGKLDFKSLRSLQSFFPTLVSREQEKRNERTLTYSHEWRINFSASNSLPSSDVSQLGDREPTSPCIAVSYAGYLITTCGEYVVWWNNDGIIIRAYRSLNDCDCVQ
jgi:hypothetical protein